MRRTIQSRRLVLAAFVPMMCALGVGCVASDKTIIAQADQFNSGIHPAAIQNPQVNPYLQQIGDRIVAAAKELDAEHVGPKAHFDDKDRSWMFSDIHWELVNSKTVNAFTTGGHYVYIYDALFQMCKTEDELAAVMSHEYGHIYCRHVQKGTGRQQVLAAATLAAAAGAKYAAGGEGGNGAVAGGGNGAAGGGNAYAQYAAAAAKEGGTLLENGFTRGDEAQADEYGFKFYVRAGWPPEHFADFFKDMIAAGYDKTPGVLSDHPTLASRVTAADKRVAALNPARVSAFRRPEVATQQQFDAAKRDAIASSQGMPDDQKVLAAKNLLQALPRSCWMPTEPDDEKQALHRLLKAAEPAQPPSQQTGG